MIYNLHAFIKAAVPTVKYIIDGWEVKSPPESVLISQSGGEPPKWYPRTDYTVQIISRACTKTLCRRNIYKTYNAVLDKFGCTLPEAIIDGETFPAIIAAQMIPIQEPGYIGVDDNKRHLYSYNLKVTVGG